MDLLVGFKAERVVLVAAFISWQMCLAPLALAQTVLRMQAPPSTGASSQRAIDALVKEIDLRTRGKVKLNVLPSGSIVPGQEVENALRTGVLELGFIPIAYLARVDKRFEVFQLPFVFEDLGAVSQFQQSPQGQELLGSLATRGVTPLAYWHDSMQVLVARKEFKTPADVRGAKIAFGPLDQYAVKAFQQVGASNVVVPGGEIAASLTNGAIDGTAVMPSFPGLDPRSTVSLTNHSYDGNVLAAYPKAIAALGPELGAAVREAVAAVAPTARQAAAVDMSAAVAKFEKSGRVAPLSRADRLAWRKALEPVYKDFQSWGFNAYLEAAKASGTGGGGDFCTLPKCRCRDRTCDEKCC